MAIGHHIVAAVSPPSTGEWGVRGGPFTQPGPLTFVVGLNLVRFPFSPSASGYDTVSLAQAVQVQGGQVAQVIRWDAGSQNFLLWSAASPTANVFPIDEKAGYFVLVMQPAVGFFPYTFNMSVPL